VRSVEEQQARVTAAAVAPRPVRLPIAEAQGLMCAEEVVAEVPMPGFDQAAIDGYAVRSADISSAEDSEVVLPVVGVIEAGSRTPSRLQPRQAARIETGAPLPNLADAVLPLRWSDAGQARVRVLRAVRSGAYVRRVGNDVQPGDVAVRSGAIIGPAQVGLLAAVGRERVLVHPRPRVSVMSVGAELVDISRTPGNGQIYDVNSYALAAAARDAGADAARVGIVSAEPRQLREVIEIQLSRSEVVVIAGDVAGAARVGIVSAEPRQLREVIEIQLSRSEVVVIAGDVAGAAAEDLRGVLSELGEMEVARVAMHPGSVQGFGQLGPDGVPTFLLPANPVSALVVFEVMIRPLIRLSLGKRQPMRRTVRARTLTPVTSVAGRTGFLRGQLLRDEGSGEYLVEPIGESAEGSSHLLASLAEANCLVVVPGPVTEIRAGEYVDVAFLAQRG